MIVLDYFIEFFLSSWFEKKSHAKQTHYDSVNVVEEVASTTDEENWQALPFSILHFENVHSPNCLFLLLPLGNEQSIGIADEEQSAGTAEEEVGRLFFHGLGGTPAARDGEGIMFRLGG